MENKDPTAFTSNMPINYTTTTIDIYTTEKDEFQKILEKEEEEKIKIEAEDKNMTGDEKEKKEEVK